MRFHSSALTLAAATALLALPGGAHAALSVYTNAASFASATAARATDTFAALPNDTIASPSTRSAGSYGYTVSAPGGLYGSGPAADPWLSSKLTADTITFSGFTGGVQAIGGLFFGADFNDDFLPGQNITLRATDSLGATATQTITGATLTSFLGFASTGSLVSLTVDVANLTSFSAIDSVTLAQVAAIPEPETYAMLLGGLGVLGWIGRRRKVAAVAAS